MSSQSGSVLVTGASRGLGPHLARRLAADGWPVAVNYRSDAAGAAHVVGEIISAGGRAEAFQADVTDEAAVKAMYTEISVRVGPIQAVVANATGPQPEI